MVHTTDTALSTGPRPAGRDSSGRDRRMPGWAPRAACLLAAMVLTGLTVGNLIVPAAAWIAPALMLRFVRQSSVWVGLGLGALAQVLAHEVAWHPVVPLAGWMLYALPAAIGLVFFVPCAVDRLLAPRLRGMAATLVFPSALVVSEFLYTRAGLGSWGALAYSQYGDLPLLQTLSLAGLSGLTFLIGWFAAAVNHLWEGGLAWPGARRPLAACGALIVAALLFGGLRLAMTADPVPTVRVAGLTIDNIDVFRDSWGPLTRGQPLTAEAAAAARPQTLALQQALLERSRAEARAGAKLVVWSEANAMVFREDEDAFLQAGRALAREEGIYLFMAMATLTPGAPLAENKLVVIDPEGQVRGQYLKSHPTPAEASVPGTGRVGLIDTPFGRIAWAICYDFDFPALIRQAGRAGADILIDPSWDNRAITPMHTQMAAFRAIENGAALFRQVNDGLSLAVDAQGRTLGQMDHGATTGPVKTLVADLPTRGTRTLYGLVGDVLPALCGLGLLVLTVRARRGPRAA